MTDYKTSELDRLNPGDLLSTDDVVVLDKSDTTGTGGGTGGTLKVMTASGLKTFTSTGSVLFFISLDGISTSQSLYDQIADAINASPNAPFSCEPEQIFLFKTISAPASPSNPDPEIVQTTYMINSGRTSAGGVGALEVLGSEIELFNGPIVTNSGDDPGSFIDLGELSGSNVWDVFNLGDPSNPAGGGLFNAWVITTDMQPIIATETSVSKVYLFAGGAGSWGGVNMGDPGVEESVAADFTDLIAEPDTKPDISSFIVEDSTVTNAKLADVATQTIKGRNTAATGPVEDLTPSQVRDIINGDAQTATGDGTTTIDWGEGVFFHFQFGAFNETFTFTAPAKPGTVLLKLVQDSVGSRTATWPATVKWPSGTAPTLTTTATTGTDIITFYYDGTNYFGVDALDFS